MKPLSLQDGLYHGQYFENCFLIFYVSSTRFCQIVPWLLLLALRYDVEEWSEWSCEWRARGSTSSKAYQHASLCVGKQLHMAYIWMMQFAIVAVEGFYLCFNFCLRFWLLCKLIQSECQVCCSSVKTYTSHIYCFHPADYPVFPPEKHKQHTDRHVTIRFRGCTIYIWSTDMLMGRLGSHIFDEDSRPDILHGTLRTSDAEQEPCLMSSIRLNRKEFMIVMRSLPASMNMIACGTIWISERV